MTSAQKATSGSGMFSNLVVLVLLALAVGLYLKVVMDGSAQTAVERPPQASVRVIESHPQAAAASVGTLPELPAEQMALIRQVFAPEMGR